MPKRIRLFKSCALNKFFCIWQMDLILLGFYAVIIIVIIIEDSLRESFYLLDVDEFNLEL